MKKIFSNNTLYILLILFFSFFSCQKLFGQNFSSFNSSFYTSHDGEGHLIRMEEFDQALHEGQFPVRLAKKINHGLGYPFFNFNYPFVYYLGEGIHLFGFSFLETFKILMILSFLIGGISIYFLSLFYFDKVSSCLAAIFFTIAPYKFLNIYVRGNVAESLGLAVIPLLFLVTELVLRNKKWSKSLFIIVLSILLLIHNITAAVGVLLIGVYIVCNRQKPKVKLRTFFVPIFVSLLLTSFFWLPVVFESNIVRISELSYDYPKFFPTFQEILYSPWGFGGYIRGYAPGKMSPQIGLIHEVMFVIGIILLFMQIMKTKKMNYFVLFFIIIGMISLFLSLPFSKFLWDVLTPLQYVQLPFRFIGYVTLSCSVLAGFILFKLPEKFRFFVSIGMVILLLFFNRNHIRVNMYYDYKSPLKEDTPYNLSTTSKEEHMPVWSPIIYKNPNQNGDITSGSSKRIIWKSNYHKFLVTVFSSTEFRDNTSYYPGWTAKIDGSKTDILYKTDIFGRLKIKVPEGKHVVEFFFTETWYRLLADLLSLFTITLFILYNLNQRFSWLKTIKIKKSSLNQLTKK